MVYQFIQHIHIVGMLCGLSMFSMSAKSVYPSNQPIVRVSTGQTAIEFIISSSSGNTTLQGAVVAANTVNADIKGNLLVQSLQDTSSYNETSKSVVSIPRQPAYLLALHADTVQIDR